jgi:hypothetical protein
MQFWVNESSAHVHVARQCLKVMEHNLRADICDVSEPGTLVQDVDVALVDRQVPLAVRYAC